MDAARTLLYYPVRVTGKAITWRAPAYFDLAGLARLGYSIAYKGGESTSQLCEAAWLFLVEGLEFIIPTRRQPYVAHEDVEMVESARAALRSALTEVLRMALHSGDVANFREALRRWRIAEQYRDDERRIPDSIQFPVALGWELIRRFSTGATRDPSEWFGIIVDGCSTGVVYGAVEQQLDEHQRFVDIDRWYSFDMPSHEAHFVDTDGPLFRLLILGVAAHTSSGQPPDLPGMSAVMYSHRTSFEGALVELRENVSSYQAAFEIADLPARVERIEQAWQERAAAFEDSERATLRAGRVSVERVREFISSFRSEHRNSNPRVTLERYGAVVESKVRLPRSAGLTLKQLEDKQYFVDRPETIGGSSTLGEFYGRGLGEAELQKLTEALSHLRARTFGHTEVVDRLALAVKHLDSLGREVAIFMPRRWEYIGPLVRAQRLVLTPGSPVPGLIGEFDGKPVIDLSFDTDWAGVVAFPGGVSLEWEEVSGRDVRVHVDTVGPIEAAALDASGSRVQSAPNESNVEALQRRVLVEIEERVITRVDRRLALRVKLGLPQT